MKKIIIACIVSVVFIGCTNSVESSIKKACSQIINETGIKKWKYAIPYITVIEDSISKDWIYYKGWIQLLNAIPSRLKML